MPTMPEGSQHSAESLYELRRENERLRGQVHSLRAEQQQLTMRMLHLAQLYTASCRLHEPEERRVLAEAIGEIIKDLIGSEAFAILELAPGASGLSLLTCMGVDPEPLRHVPLAEGPIGRVAHTGTLWMAESAPARESEPSVCIPLKSGGRVYGVVAIFQLLPHRPDRFTPADRAFFELLETQAGRALHFSFLDVTETPPSEPPPSVPSGGTPP